MSVYGSDSLLTIGQDGKVPDCRMKDARQTQDFARRLIDNDTRRSYKRSRVNGIVDGNPPFKLSLLRQANRADACNVNWGIPRSYLESAVGAFYDLFSEAPGFITFRTSYGTPEQRNQWSNDASALANDIIKKDTVFDYNMQLSQWDMVLHGCGPLFFEDYYTVLPRAVACGDLKVPEFTRSDTYYWDAGFIQITYYPPELFAFIQDEQAATAAGWDVAYVRRVIQNAMDIRVQAGIQYEWEFYQQELKNNSLNYYDDSKICRLALVFWKEFDGTITQTIVERDTADGLQVEYLFKHVGRYGSFQNCLHPMYFDHGNGGYHHSVTGLGVKMYSALEYQNRLICNLADKAFSPKIIFKPTSTEATARFQLATFGDYAVSPPGMEMQQTGVAGLMNDGLAMNEAINEVMQSNLSSYRQQVPVQTSGNPPTRFQKQMEAMQQAALNKTQFNRYYEQLDMLYAEIWRRLSDFNTTDDRAKEFQRKCRERGVPMEALQRSEYVGATRVAGQGSAFMRKMAIDSLMGVVGALPEEGRANLLADKIAAEAGQSAVSRYYPQRKQTQPDQQQANAIQWIASMKVGVPPVVTSEQNAVTYAATFIKAAVDAFNSLKQGGNPADVFKFVNLCGAAIAAQLNRIEHDPTRQQVYQTLMGQWKQLAAATDKLKKQLQQQQQQQKAQQQNQQQTMSDIQLKTAKTKADIQLKAQKTHAQLVQSAQKHQQSMAIEDAKTAHEMALSRLHATNTNGEE